MPADRVVRRRESRDGAKLTVPYLESNDGIRRLLSTARTIAVVGLSADPRRDSHGVVLYLINAGFSIFPVNPNIESVFGLASYATLDDVPEQIDIVDIFRRPEFVPDLVEAAIMVRAKAVWMQLGVFHAHAAQRAGAGLQTVVDRCIMVEHQRLVV